MALIKCPECGEIVSDQAEICIHCGYPLKDYFNRDEVNNLIDELHRVVGNFIIKCIKQHEGNTSDIRPELVQIISSIQEKTVSLSKSEKNKINDAIAEMILDASKAIFGVKKYATQDYSDLFSLVSFSDLSENEMQQIADFIIKKVGKFQERPDEYMSFWYPTYQILRFGTQKQKDEMNTFLDRLYETKGDETHNKTQIITRRPGYDLMVSKYSNHKDLSPIKDEPADDQSRLKDNKLQETRKRLRNVIIALVVVVGGIILFVAVVEYRGHAYSRAQKKAEQSYSNYQQTKSTLDELEREKSAVDAAIDAIESNK